MRRVVCLCLEVIGKFSFAGLCASFIAAFLLVAVPSPVGAATKTWSGASTGNWNLGANWSGSAPGDGDDLVFPVSASRFLTTNDFTQLRALSITFAGSNYVLRSATTTNTLTISNGIAAYNLSGSNSISLARLTNAASQTISCSNAAASLSFGVVALASNSLTTVAGAGSVYFNLQISGVAALALAGPGKCFLQSNNRHTGGTTVSNALLVASGNQPLNSVLLLSGGAITGAGNVSNLTVAAGASVTPGYVTPGVLSCNSLQMDAGSTLNIALNSVTNYAVLDVRGTNLIDNASLNLTVVSAPIDGDQYTILYNEDVNGINGQFLDLPEGAILSVGARKFIVSYAGGDGNDVVLTFTNTSLAAVSAGIVGGGNGDTVIDAGECNTFSIIITNVSGAPISGLNARLSPLTKGVVVTQPDSAYPNLAANARGTNLTPFQVSTLANFSCGTNVTFELAVTTATNGTVKARFTLPSGFTGAAVTFTNSVGGAVTNLDTSHFVNNVSGIATPVRKVTFGVYLNHAAVGDLTLRLISPDGTMNLLSAHNGGTNDDYGTGCTAAGRTTFDDGAATSITAGVAPFVGTFRPQEPLSAFIGKYGTNVNGPWTLEIVDDGFGSNTNETLRCWTLSLSPATCAPAGGACDYCADSTITGTLSDASPVQTDRMTRFPANVSVCDVPKDFPGSIAAGATHYEAYTYVNGPTDACVTVTFSAPAACDLMSAVYLGSFVPADISSNYLADYGNSTYFSSVPTTYSFNVPSNATFVVVVSEVENGPCGPYSLTVSGGGCSRVLGIDRLPAGRARLQWPTTAVGFNLQSTPGFSPTNWAAVTNLPVVTGGKFTVTNTPGSNRFFRLVKP